MRVQIKARRRGEQARHKAKPIFAEVEIPPDELEKFLTELTDGGLDAALQNIAGHFVRHLDTLRDRLRRFRKEFPMGTMWTIAKMAEDQMVGQIGSVDTDPDGALLNAVADEIRHRKFFLEKAFDRLSKWSSTRVAKLQFITDRCLQCQCPGPGQKKFNCHLVASTFFENEPFGEHSEGLSYCGDESCAVGRAVREHNLKVFQAHQR